MYLRISALLIGLFLIGASAAVAGQIPDSVRVILPEGFSEIESFDWNGSMTADGISVTWTATDFDAEFVFTGSKTGFQSPYIGPGIEVRWLETGAILPLSVNVTANTGGNVHIFSMQQALINNPEDWWDPIITDSGDIYFGHYYPDLYQVYFGVFAPSAVGDPFQMTITMEWGPGVPLQQTSWSKVKSLYR